MKARSYLLLFFMVWTFMNLDAQIDTDGDGIQDAGEAGIDGVAVQIYQGSTLVGTTTTANGGQWYFNPTNVNQNGATALLPNTAYTISVPAASFPSGLSLTTQGSTTGQPDVRDSDASLVSGNAQIAYTTGAAGQNDHTLDIGFRAAAACTLTVDSAVPTACTPVTNTYNLAVTVSYSGQPTGDITINVGGTNYTFTPDGTSPDTYTVTGLTSNGTTGVDVSATFVGDNACTNTLADAYNAPSSCSASPCPIPALWAIDEDTGRLFSASDWTSTAGINSTSYNWGVIQWSTNNCVTKSNVNASGGSELESAAWDRATNEYYFTSNKDLGSFNAPVLLKIDIDNLVAGQQPCAIVIGSIAAGGQDIESLAMDPMTNELYGGSKVNGMLYKLNKTTAAVDAGYPVQMTKPSPLSGNLNDSESLTFDNNGNLYVSETDDRDVYIINKVTGAGISVYDDNTASLGLDGITWDFVNNRLIGFEDKSLSVMESNIYEITSGNGGNILMANSYASGMVDIEGLELMCPAVIGCVIEVTSATPSVCNPATNTYSLSVVVNHSNGPGGNITIQTSTGASLTVAVGSSPQTIMIPNLPANGATNIGVTAFFVNETTCTYTLNNAYNAPTSCAIGCSAGVNTPTVYCFDNSTYSNNGDDWFSVSLIGTITSGSGNYVVKVGAYTSPSTASGTVRSIVGNGIGGNPTFSANGTSTYILRIEDASDSNCFTTVVVGPVANCSNCPIPNCGNVTVQKN